MVPLSSLAIRRHIRRRTRRRRQPTTRPKPIGYLPEEIMELIFSKCPVKSVLRFKSVSKSWHSIISSRRFSRIHHIERSKLPENQNKMLLWAWECSQVYLIRWEENESIARTESMLPYPSPVFHNPLCSCDGLILLLQKTTGILQQRYNYILWNPSIRTHITIRRPPSAAARPRLIHFYYDPTADDHRIVFSTETSYTVYSCNKGNWSRMQHFPCFPGGFKPTQGVYLDGRLYGLLVMNDDEIACFDTRDGNLHKFRQPHDAEWPDSALKVVSGRLCCDGFLKDSNQLQRWAMMEEHGGVKKWVREKMKTTKKKNKSGFWKLINMEKEEVAEFKFTFIPNFCVYMTQKYGDSCKYSYFPYSENLHMPALPCFKNPRRAAALD